MSLSLNIKYNQELLHDFYAIYNLVTHYKITNKYTYTYYCCRHSLEGLCVILIFIALQLSLFFLTVPLFL